LDKSNKINIFASITVKIYLIMEAALQKLLPNKETVLVSKDNCAEIYHLPDSNIVYVLMQGLSKNQCYRLNADRSLSVLQRFKATCLIMDFSNLMLMSADDQEWIEDVWQKQAVEAGLKQMAAIMPDNLFAALSINKLTANIKRNNSFESASFMDSSDAYSWLSSSLATS